MSQPLSLEGDLDSSTAAMLAEHERLAELFLYNTELGDKRASLYLTIVSIGIAGMVGLAQFNSDLDFLLAPGMGLVAGMLVVGLLTFYRLIERRIRATECLRAINRIHRYFVDKDASLGDYFFWPANDDVPTFLGTGTAQAGLRDVVSLLNSLFAGVLCAEIAYLVNAGAVPAIIVGLLTGLFTWFLHTRYERLALTRAEQEGAPRVKFPQAK